MACGAPALGCGNRHREDPSATRGPDDLGAFGRPPGYGHERIPRSLDRFAYARDDGPLCRRVIVGQKLERAKGIEPSYEAWEASVLPLNYARVCP
jgi:hypothetical protein